MRVSEIRGNRIRVNQGLGVIRSFLKVPYASLNYIQFQDRFSSKLSRIFLAWKMKLESFHIKLREKGLQ